MGVYYAKGSSGQVYPFEIKGNEISKTESQRISEYLTQIGDPDESLIQEEPSGLRAAFRGGLDTLQLGFGSAIEGLGKSTGFDWLEETGQEIIETNKQQLAENEEYRTRLDDVKDIGSAGQFFGETIAEQSTQIGTTLAGSGAGAAIGGAFLGPAGAILGGIAGGIGVNLPFFYGMNREAQKDTSPVVDEGVALLTALPQSALDFIADRIVIGSFIKPTFIAGGGIFTRGVKGATVGSAAEVPTELGQQVLERMQAGKEILSEEAIKEYREVAVAAGLVGGTFRGTANIVGGDKAKKEKEAEATKKKAELDQDMSELRENAVRNRDLARKKTADLEADQSVRQAVIEQGRSIEERTLELEENSKLENVIKKPISVAGIDQNRFPNFLLSLRQYRQALGKDPNKKVTDIDEIRDVARSTNDQSLSELADIYEQSILTGARNKAERKSSSKKKFTQEQYDVAVEQVKKDGVFKEDNVHKVVKKDKNVGRQVTEAIRDEMIANRFIRREGNGYVPLTEEEVAINPANNIKAFMSGRQKLLDEKRKQKNEMKKNQEALLQQWDGSPSQENALNVSTAQDRKLDREINGLEIEVNNLQRQIDTIESRSKNAGKIADQTFTTEDSILALKVADEASKIQPRAEYQAKKQKIAKKIEDYGRKQLGLGNRFSFKFEDDLSRSDRVGGGYYQPSQKLIALSIGIYNPNLSDQEYISKIKGVMNHETIHALRDVGLFTKEEYNSLVNAANTRKVTVVVDGENVERSYSFVERAIRLNRIREGETEAQFVERLNEEAVAEMFRAYADGSLKVAGKPLSLFKRIINFFKGIRQTHENEGFKTVDSIFDNILSGEIGRRDPSQMDSRIESRYGKLPDEFAVIDSVNRDYSEIGTQEILPDDVMRNAEFKSFVDRKDPETGKIIKVLKKSPDGEKIRKKMFLNRELEDGTLVVLRPNLNGFMTNESGRPSLTQTVHSVGVKKGIEAESTSIYGTAIGYDLFAAVTDPIMKVNQGARRDIYNGVTRTGAKQNKFPMAGSAGYYRNITREQAESIINNPDNVLSFNPGNKEKGFVGTHLFVDQDGFAVKSVKGTNLHYQGKVYVKGEVEYWDEADAPNSQDLPSEVKFKKIEPKDYSEIPMIPENAGVLNTDTSIRGQTNYGLLPFLRVPTDKFYDHKRKILQSINPKNADKQLDALDDILTAHPDAMSSEEAFKDYLADAMGIANDGSLPLIPFAAIKMANDSSLIENQIGGLSEGQLALAQSGFESADKFEQAYRSGSATPKHTGLLILWGILSRGVSPYVQESLFLDVVQERGNMAGVGAFIEEAADGRFSATDYENWVESILPENSPGNGAKHNLNAFGKTTLAKLGKPDNKGITPLKRLHDLMSDYSLNGKQVRREFHRLNEGIGINNKVLSFALLVSGRNDVMVLDRVQFRNLFNDGRFGTLNLYDGIKDNDKEVTGSKIAKLGDGSMGLMYYEAIERGMMPSIQQAYDNLGRGEQASMGRYHWESWVAQSAQEVDHGTVDGIISDSLGIEQPYRDIRTKQGKYDTYQAGSSYGYNSDGVPFLRIPDGLNNMFEFTPQRASKVFDEIKKRKNEILPVGFKISENREKPYYERDDVNRENLSALLQREGGRIVQPRISGVSENYANVSRKDTRQEDIRDYSIVPAVDGLNTLKDFIRNNPDGFTINSQFTDKLTGISVAPIKTSEIITGQDVPLSVLREYVTNAIETSKIFNKNIYLGGWLNTQDNKYYIDSSLVLENKDDALYIAQAAEQEAIYDITNKQFVRTENGIRELQRNGTYRDNTAEQYRRGVEQASKLFTKARLQNPERSTLQRDRRQDVLDLFDTEDDFTERLSPEDQAQVQEVQDLFSQIPEAPLDFSEVPTNPSSPILNPVARRARAKDEYVKNPHLFGIVMDRGRKTPVALLAGQHGENRPIQNMGDFGLYHIQQRKHDIELREYSKFPSIQDAMYGMMRTWERQNFEDGPDLISISQGGGDLRFEWRNPGFKSPPIVASLAFQPNRGKPFYHFRTFYPELTAKQKKVIGIDEMSIPLSSETIAISNQVNESNNQIVYSKSYQVLKKIVGMNGLLSDKKSEDITKGFLINFQDKMLPMAEIIDKLRSEGANITDALDPYLSESLYHGTSGDRVDTATQGLYEPTSLLIKDIDITESQFESLKVASSSNSIARNNGFVEQSIENSGSKKTTAIEAYLYALHAKERNEYIRSIDPENYAGSGMSDGEADAIIEWVNSLSPSERQKFENIRASVRDIVANTNKIRKDSGLVPEDVDTAEAITDENGDKTAPPPQYKDYLPLRGILDPLGEAHEDGSFASTGGTSYSVRGREDRRALGRFDYATNILTGVFMQNQNSIIRSEKNAVAKSFLDLIRSDPERMSQYAIELEKLPTRRGIVNGVVKMIPNFNYAQDPSILTLKEGGEFVHIRLQDARLGRALNGSVGVSTQTSNLVIKSLAKINRYLSNINTSYNPEFMITNFFRDFQTGLVNVNQYERKGLAKETFFNIKSAARGIKKMVRDGEKSTITKEQAEAQGFDINSISDVDVFRLFQLYGGQNALNQMNDLQDQINNVNKIVGDIADAGLKGKWNTVKNSFIGKKTGSLLNFLENYNTVVENTIRVATFKTLAPKIGFKKAAFAARNVTVDFAKGGEYKTLMNSLYLFYNASIQGSFALLNAATRSSKVRKIWASLVVVGILQDQINAMFSEEDEDGELVYDKAPQHILEHNIIFPDFFNITDRSHVTIPMPYGLNIAVNLGRSLSRFQRGAYEIGEAGSSIMGTAIDNLNPIGGTNSFFNFASPTVTDPFVDILRNRDFSERPIVKETSPFDPTPPPNSQLYWSTTSPSAKWVAENLNQLTGGSNVQKGFVDVSPDMIEFWIGYLTGGVGRFSLQSFDFATNIFPTALTEGFEDEFIRQTPLVRKVLYSVSEREDLTNFIEKRDKVLMAQEVLKSAIENRDTSGILSARERYSDELRIFGQIKALNNARGRMLRKMKMVKDNPNLPDEQKEKILERMGEQLDNIVSRANKIMNDNL